jgi:hypothetical protein
MQAHIVISEADLSKIIKSRTTFKMSPKDAAIATFPMLDQCKLKAVDSPRLCAELLTLEEKLVETNYKFGVLLCRNGQIDEDDMFSNETGSEVFEQFLDCIGDRVTLKGFKNFRGGLDVREDTTGVESVYSRYRNMEIMFHVSTLLPYTQQNKQQIARKAHIGNDIGIIIFKEGSKNPTPFNPESIVSQFPHFLIVVEHIVDGPIGDPPRFRIAACRKDDVPGRDHTRMGP